MPKATLEPLAVPVVQAVMISGRSRLSTYRELAVGNIRAVKQGSRILVMVDSIRVYLAGLPVETFRELSAKRA